MIENDPNLVRNVNHIPERIRLVDLDKTWVATRPEVLARLKEENLDLYLLNRDADPPVYKMLDYGRYRFDKQKKDREQKKKLRDQARPLKEFKFKPGTDDHDVEVKIHHILENLPEHDIKVCMDLKGKGGARQNWVTLTNRGTRPVSAAVAAEDFVLNRVLETIKNSACVQQTRLNITDNQIYAIVRYDVAVAEKLEAQDNQGVQVSDR